MFILFLIKVQRQFSGKNRLTSINVAGTHLKREQIHTSHHVKQLIQNGLETYM